MVSPKEQVSTGGSMVDADVCGTQAGGGTNEDLKHSLAEETDQSTKEEKNQNLLDLEALKAKGGEEPNQSTEKGTKRKSQDLQALKEKGGAEYIQHLEMMYERLTDEYLNLKYELFVREAKLKMDYFNRLKQREDLLRSAPKKQLEEEGTIVRKGLQ